MAVNQGSQSWLTPERSIPIPFQTVYLHTACSHFSIYLVTEKATKTVFQPGSTSVSVGEEATASADYVRETGTKPTYYRKAELSQTYS